MTLPACNIASGQYKYMDDLLTLEATATGLGPALFKPATPLKVAAWSAYLRDTQRERTPLPTKRQGPRPSAFFKSASLASTGTDGARIFNYTHSMQVKTGTPSEVPICCTTRQATSSTTNLAKNHSSTSHDCPHHHQSITPTGKVLEVLHALPQILLPSLGISLDRDIASQ